MAWRKPVTFTSALAFRSAKSNLSSFCLMVCLEWVLRGFFDHGKSGLIIPAKTVFSRQIQCVEKTIKKLDNIVKFLYASTHTATHTEKPFRRGNERKALF